MATARRAVAGGKFRSGLCWNLVSAEITRARGAWVPKIDRNRQPNTLTALGLAQFFLRSIVRLEAFLSPLSAHLSASLEG